MVTTTMPLMQRPTISRAIGRLLPMLAVLWMAIPASAQTPLAPPRIPGEVDTNRADPAWIGSRLRLGLDYHRKAIARLGGELDPEAIKEIDQIIYRAYTAVRAAHGGVTLKISRQKGRLNKGVADPILLMEEDQLAKARKLILAAKFQVKYWRPGQSVRIEKGVAHLLASSARIQQALGLMGQTSAN